ncbi:hypothetical protein [Rhodococcus sp. ARP2]|uniref:hypothetical protein n=1 Tax=Rhodococcus sp. ARP2 TaxID=1661385 RepID=UPI00064C12FB|nr:hypothetical protein [Rhodococcus sp. ARP2]
MAMSRETFDQLNRNKLVRGKVREVAARKAARAQQITDNEGGSAVISIKSGTRPKGRAFANIQSSSADEEFGTSTKARRRALGRAARKG